MFGSFSTSRRQFVAGAAAVGAIGALPSVTRATAGNSAIRPFKIAIPDADIAAMKRRIAETRWADAQPVSDDGQGVRRQTLEPLMRYWAGDYDWRKIEARLNTLPMFITEIDGLDIHFIHIRSRHEQAIVPEVPSALAAELTAIARTCIGRIR